MTPDPRAYLREHAPWLFAADLGVCIVGSSALALACEQTGIRGPDAKDVDISWALDLDAGEALLREHGVFQNTTVHNRARGTLAMKLGGDRVEVTTFRGDPATTDLRGRVDADLGGRDMTIGALAWRIADDTLADPYGGLEDWRAGRIVPVGDPAERIREHPVRWLRYYRRAHQWGFTLDESIRKVGLDRATIRAAPIEAVSAEIRSALADCASPGQFFLELAECGLLPHVAPELATQFDGRPAGAVRHHPEVSQALHLILALEWIAAEARGLDERDHNRVLVAVLCHDLGKGLTPPEEWPAHRGHEESGIGPIRSLLDRLPGLTDSTGRRLAEAVCRLHLVIRNFATLRPGTRAKLFERHFRDSNLDAHLFGLAVGADSGGRLGREATGRRTAAAVEAAITWMRTRAATVDVGALYEQFGADMTRFQSEVHQAYARALRGPPDEKRDA